MTTSGLLAALGYPSSEEFLSWAASSAAPEHAHIFRRAISSCNLVGGFALRPQRRRSSEDTPVVLVVEASSDKNADEIHRHVWNQNITPFLLVRTPEHVRLYSGFEYAPAPAGSETQIGLLRTLIRFDEVLTKLSDFRAKSIEDGTLWRLWGKKLRPEARVDWKLLGNLEELGRRLHADDLSRPIAHALIGKFVYLRYLRDRDILSDKKLAEWRIEPETVFSNQRLTFPALQNLIAHVDEWLNGSIFPFPSSQVRQRHLREVAGVFLGNDPATGQLHLDFQAYDFSHIPIETLSVIYEQFLRLEGKDDDSGAYYTPLPVVNFMLAELDAMRPLKAGMRVLDPSCGSGAFLVQCYRRLAETYVRSTSGRPKPAVLRDLLEKHIFGVDRDPDACRVAELSLVLTMLDYIDPPDLTNITSRFKLPELHNSNIFEADFFDSKSQWAASDSTGFSWIVGNPPWKQISSVSPGQFRTVLNWINANRAEHPTVQNEAAEAFAWRVADYAEPGAVAALLMPAMSLVRTTAQFRARFFGDMQVESVANFSNLREVLFAGRARQPAAAVFYRPRRSKRSAQDLLVYSPLVINQEANRPTSGRQETWSIVLNSSEVRRISHADIATGEALPWKLALWGSHRDGRLIRGLEGRFESFAAYLQKKSLTISQGLELRSHRESGEKLERVPELIGKHELDMTKLRLSGRIHSIPKSALCIIDSNRAYVRDGRATFPLAVSRPPHVIVSADRRFAVYSNRFIAIPNPQIGISGDASAKDELKLIAVFLSSSFCRYYEFYRAPLGGIREGRGSLAVLKTMPIPLGDLSTGAKRDWLELHKFLADGDYGTGDATNAAFKLISHASADEDDALEHEQALIDDLVSDALGLTNEERFLIDDLVKVRIPLADGKVAGPAIKAPRAADLRAYARALEDALNAFTGSQHRHRIGVVMADDVGGVAEIVLESESPGASETRLLRGDEQSKLREIFSKLSARNPQWLYFDRNLFVHEEERTYILKPPQLFWWSRSQALTDADELIAAFLSPPAAHADR